MLRQFLLIYHFKKRLFLAFAYRQFVLIDMNHIAFDAVYFVDIDDVGTMHSHKLIGRQMLHDITQRK